MRLHSDGNVGIGLTNPTKKLEVIGDISCSGEITSTGGVVAGFNTDISGIFGRANIGYIGHTDWAGFSHIDRSTPNNFALLQSTGGETVLNASLGQPVKFHINNTEKMRLQSDGNVGIGITSPIAKLDVDGVLLVRAYGATATQETKGIFFRNGTTPANYAASGLDYRYSLSIFPYDMNEENFTNGLSINADAGVSICTGSMTRQERFRVDQNGNVGIGLTNATKRLEVVGDISGSGAISAGKSKDVSAYIGYARIGFNGEWTSQASFGHEDVSAGSAAITQNSGGSTTIGTTGGGVGGKTGSLINFCGANSTIMMAHADDDGGRLGIGIGATYPTEKLEVSGNIIVSGSGNITAASMGRAIVGNYSNASFANFGHKDLPGDNDYALIHHDSGTTYLNASLNQKIHFRINHVTKMFLDSIGNLDVEGDIQMKTLSTPVIGKMTPVYARGFGQMNPSRRIVRIGDTTYVDTPTRGLTLTIINAGTHAHVSSSNYDTFLGSIKSNLLATAIGGMGDDKIGILTSADAIESSNGLGENLKAMALKVGLTKLAGICEWTTNNRHPYVAIFYGQGNSSLPSGQAIEIIKSNNASAAHATLSTWLIDDTFIGQTTTTALYNPIGDNTEPTVFVDSQNNVGIGTTTPDAKLDVWGGTNAYAIIGKARIGYAGIDDWATISHLNNNTYTNFGFGHSNLGTAQVNCAVGQSIYFSIGSAPKMYLKSDGNFGIGTTQPSVKLEVLGTIFASVSITSSDDRLKHNEVVINNGLEMVRLLNPQIYDKTLDMKAIDFSGSLADVSFNVEAGFIAQEVALITDLSYCVGGGETVIDDNGNYIDKPFNLNYNNLFTYNVAATKELDAIVSAQAIIIQDLQTRLAALET